MENANTPASSGSDPFEMNLLAGELRKGGLRLKRTGQPFEVLAILLETIVRAEERSDSPHAIF